MAKTHKTVAELAFLSLPANIMTGLSSLCSGSCFSCWETGEPFRILKSWTRKSLEGDGQALAGRDKGEELVVEYKTTSLKSAGFPGENAYMRRSSSERKNKEKMRGQKEVTSAN